MKPIEQYPALGRFLAGYFHQDWVLDDPDTAAVVDRFVREAGPEQVQAVIGELDRLLASNLDPGSLEALVSSELNCSYYPPGEGMSYPQWLRWLRGRLAGVP